MTPTRIRQQAVHRAKHGPESLIRACRRGAQERRRPGSARAIQLRWTLGQLQSELSLDALLNLAHARSSDPWFRVALLSSVANSPSHFFYALLAKGHDWADTQMLAYLSALIGARQDRAELARWFSALPSNLHPDAMNSRASRAACAWLGNTRIAGARCGAGV